MLALAFLYRDLRSKYRVLALLSIAVLGLQAQTSRSLLAYEPFDSAPGVLQGAASGAGWAGGWDVQNPPADGTGFNVADAVPLSYPGLPQTGNYASGGYQFNNGGRRFDTTATGSFAGFLTANGLIGQPGQTIWMSVLMRKNSAAADSFFVALHGGGTDYWESVPGVDIGYFGADSRDDNGVNYWGLRLDNVVYRSSMAMVPGQAALLVLRMDFGATSTVSLYVNPNPGTMPANPDAVASTTNPIAFQSLLFASGWASDDTAIDEVRLAADYYTVLSSSSVMPASPTGLKIASTATEANLTWNSVAGAASYQVWRSSDGAHFSLLGSSTTANYADANIVQGAAYQYYVVAQNAVGSSAASEQAVAFPRPPVTPQAGMGMNVAGICDWSRQWPFVDIFKMARPWISQQVGAPWGQGGALNLTPDGWPASLADGQYVETVIFDNALDDSQASFPTGEYTLLYDGEGTIEFDLNTASIVSQTPGRMVVSVPANSIGIFLKITQTNPANPLHNIRFIMPGFENSYQAQPFHPTFLNRLQGMKTIRFMEWLQTNGSTAKTWSDRALPSDYTYSWRGASLESMILLANTVHASPWFNMPHQADDDYVRQFATMVYQNLDPSLKVYIEYSNETWNSQFVQNAYVQNLGLSLGLDQDPNMAGAYYTSVRSVQIFKIWQDVFGGTDRLVRILPSQAADAGRSKAIAAYQNAYGYADALAIAPYYSVCSDAAKGGWGFLGDPSTVNQVTGLSVDQILNIEMTHIQNCALDEMTSNATVAQQYNLRLISYEGGQHLLGLGSAQNNQQLIALFKAANRNPRIQDLYTQYLQNWKSIGGDLFVNYSDVGAYTQYGNFGALEYQNQDITTAPKLQAIMQFAAENQ